MDPAQRYVIAFWRKLRTNFWHILRARSFVIDCLIDQIKVHQQAHSLARFYPHGHFITDLDQSTFVQQKNPSKMVFSFCEQF